MAVVVNSGTFFDTSNACRAVAPAVRTVNAASYIAANTAPAALITLFGEGLATETAQAGAMWPAILGGTRVMVTDSGGTTRDALLYYVSPSQINLLVPAATVLGQARIQVRRSDTVTANGSVNVARVGPGLFSANATGSGVAAATAVALTPTGAQRPVTVFTCGTAPSMCVPEPIDVSGDPVVISLYGTGLRGNTGVSSVSVSMGGVPAQVLYAGPQNQYLGLDQVNAIVPVSLRGRGTVNLTLSVAGVGSNTVTIAIR
jgi:uncharacterized protein (TIGR03437 family)